jgi:hypothetical protein
VIAATIHFAMKTVRAAYPPPCPDAMIALHPFPRHSRFMCRRFLILLVAMTGMLLCGVAMPEAAQARVTLRDLSLAIVDLYNAEDGIGLYTRVSEPLAARLSTEILAERLSDCRQRFGPLQRLSLPVASNSTSALFATYFEKGLRDMYLEIDQDGGIRLLTFAGLGESCALIGP